MLKVVLCLLALTTCARPTAPAPSPSSTRVERSPDATARPDAAMDSAPGAPPDTARQAPTEPAQPTTEAALMPGVLVELSPVGRRATPNPWRVPRSERIVRHEVAYQTVDDNGVRYALVETRCSDLIPRGGSDCADMGFAFRERVLRAVALPGGRRLWSRPLAWAERGRARLSVRGDALIVSDAGRTSRFRTRDGAPLP